MIKMKAYDFEYDGIALHNFGYIICEFDGNGDNTVSNGSEITFNTFKSIHNAADELSSAEYENAIEATFQICRDDCLNQAPEMPVSDIRELSKWLNRKKFLKFKILDEEYKNLYFEASFNISRIEIGGVTYGLELEMITNRPYAREEPVAIVLNTTENNQQHNFVAKSDEEGFIYPSTTIEVLQDGDLIIYTEPENRTTLIKNCKQGETLTLNYPIIQSSLDSHKIMDDFNWTFPRISNSYRNNMNEFIVSIPCNITMWYSPIAKISI